MEVRYDDHQKETLKGVPKTRRTSVAHVPAREEDIMTHTSDARPGAYDSLSSNESDREQLLSALAHAAEERQAAQEAIHLSEIRYRRLFEASKDSVIIIATDDLTIVDANHAAERLTGNTSQELFSQTVTDRFPFDRIPDMTAQLRQLINQQLSHLEITIMQGHGRLEHLDIIASVYTEQKRSITQLSIRDITDRKTKDRLETKAADLLAERQELLAVNSAKDEFISVASHQLRTPATAVKQYLGLLLQGFMGPLTRDQRHTLERAFTSNERQLKIISDLLLVARVDAGKVVLRKEPIDLTRLIRDIVDEQRHVLERRHQPMTLRLPRSLKAVVDARFLRMVIENLLSNASKYSPENKPISITAVRERRHIRVTVTDEGFGISAADQSKLYQKFSRIYNEHATTVEGTGLGLYWSKKIIELHDGELLLESELNRGSTFTICLPAGNR
jgi:two-component system sensor histidine kinase VicK